MPARRRAPCRAGQPVLLLTGDPALRVALLQAAGAADLPAVAAERCADAVDRLAAARPAAVLLDTSLAGWLDVLLLVRAAFTPPVPIVLVDRRGRAGAAEADPTRRVQVVQGSTACLLEALVAALPGGSAGAGRLRRRTLSARRCLRRRSGQRR